MIKIAAEGIFFMYGFLFLADGINEKLAVITDSLSLSALGF